MLIFGLRRGQLPQKIPKFYLSVETYKNEKILCLCAEFIKKSKSGKSLRLLDCYRQNPSSRVSSQTQTSSWRSRVFKKALFQARGHFLPTTPLMRPLLNPNSLPDIFGRRKFFVFSQTLLSISTFLCAISASIYFYTGLRVLHSMFMGKAEKSDY